MPTFSSYSALGASIETPEIIDGAVTNIKIADGTIQEPKLAKDDMKVWTFIEKVTAPGSAASVTSSALTVYDEYMAILNIETDANISIQFNSDTGGNYFATYIDNVTVTVAGSTTSIYVGSASSVDVCIAEVHVKGISKAVANGRVAVSIIPSGQIGAGGKMDGLCGSWAGGNATQVSTMTFLVNTGNILGSIEIYGRNYLT